MENYRAKTILTFPWVVIFLNALTLAFYEHFFCLHVAMKLLSFKPWCFDDNEYA